MNQQRKVRTSKSMLQIVWESPSIVLLLYARCNRDTGILQATGTGPGKGERPALHCKGGYKSSSTKELEASVSYEALHLQT